MPALPARIPCVPGLEALKSLQAEPRRRKETWLSRAAKEIAAANFGCPGDAADGRAFAENADNFWRWTGEEEDATSADEEDSAALDELLAVVEKERLAMKCAMQTPANEEGQQPSGLEACRCRQLLVDLLVCTED